MYEFKTQVQECTFKNKAITLAHSSFSLAPTYKHTHTENSRQRTNSDILCTPIWPFEREMVCSEERDWHEAFSRPNKVCNVCVCVSVSIVVREKEDWGSKGETCVLREKKWEIKKKNSNLRRHCEGEIIILAYSDDDNLMVDFWLVCHIENCMSNVSIELSLLLFLGFIANFLFKFGLRNFCILQSFINISVLFLFLLLFLLCFFFLCLD